MAFEQVGDVTARVLARLEARIGVRERGRREAAGTPRLIRSFSAANDNGVEAGTCPREGDMVRRPGLVTARGGVARLE